MGTFARIDGDKVVELFEEPDDGFEMKDRFHPLLVWVDVTTLYPPPAQGWTAEKSNEGNWILSPQR